MLCPFFPSCCNNFCAATKTEAIGNTNMGIENEVREKVWHPQRHATLLHTTKMITSLPAIFKVGLPSVTVAQQPTRTHWIIAWRWCVIPYFRSGCQNIARKWKMTSEQVPPAQPAWHHAHAIHTYVYSCRLCISATVQRSMQRILLILTQSLKREMFPRVCRMAWSKTVTFLICACHPMVTWMHPTCMKGCGYCAQTCTLLLWIARSSGHSSISWIREWNLAAALSENGRN